MPFVVERSNGPSKMFAVKDGDEFMWTPNKAKAHRFTEEEADAFCHEFSKYSDTELDIVGIKDPTPPDQQAVAA